MLYLNNKGFAISTILYGSLTVILILLMAIFVTIRTSKNLNDNFTNDIEKRLNSCVTDEIILEQCYMNNTVCDKTTYYSCIGISDDDAANPSGLPTIKEKLVPASGAIATGLYADEHEPNRYIYKGASVNNYVSYVGHNWRIIAIESDSTIKIMYQPSAGNITWDLESGIDWASSSLNNNVNTTFFDIVTDVNKLAKKTWNVGIIYAEDTENVNGILNLKDIMRQEKVFTYSGTDDKGYVGVPSSSDYIRASTVAGCVDNPFGACTSWMPGDMWTINSYVGPDPSIKEAVVISGGKLTKKLVTTSTAIYPVVYLHANVKIASGSGTSASPYVLN